MLETKETTLKVTPAPVADDAVGVPEIHTSHRPESTKKWFIAFVGTRAEKAVRDRLLKDGIEAYAATQHELRVRPSGRRVKVERPVITQYVFIHVSEEERRVIVEYPYIHYFLTDKATATNDFGRHRLAVIPDDQMRMLQSMLSQEDAEVLFATTGFTLGDEVNVLGWNDDITGHIVQIRGKKGRHIGIRIDQLGCAYMEISPTRLIKKRKI